MGFMVNFAEGFVFVLLSYLSGCILVAYYLVLKITGEDIRHFGSGNPGARNVGRVLGPFGFSLTLMGDAAKGAVPVALAIYLDLPAPILQLTMLAAIAGHIWPVHLGFSGGKGFATMIGVLMAYDFWLFAQLLTLTAILTLLTGRSTLSGLLSISLAPLLAYFYEKPVIEIIGLAGIAVLVVSAHHSNIQASFKEFVNIPE